MLNITKEQKELIQDYIPKLDEYIVSEDIEELLIDLDDAIILNGLDETQDFLTPLGQKLQKTYDEIYNQN